MATTQNYHAPQNSFINIALETKKANPLMLSILYMEVARSAEIPIYGINLPEHFILCYKDEQSMMGLMPDKETKWNSLLCESLQQGRHF
jgi:regulator of sirC expression with transglutaminase-like and TPR domain